MRRFVLAVVIGQFFGGNFIFAQAPDPPRSTAADFRRIIETAKGRVYPALIFVKPIREEFSGGEQKRQEVFGSGVIISPDGLAVTNHHVVEQATEIQVVLSDKRQVPAEIVGKDAETDLALLRLKGLEEGETLTYASFADSDQVQSGDFVMAFGSPFGFARSVSLGIVSNTERYLGFESKHVYNNFIQTDAAINPGNSGGALVDTSGHLVGINTAIYSRSGGSQGIGFAIPVSLARQVMEQIIATGRVSRGWLGVSARDVIHETTGAAAGAALVAVQRGGPAERAGLRAGDTVVSINGKEIGDTAALINETAALAPGTKAQFKVLRERKVMALAVVLGQRPVTRKQ